ncbi:MAG TPA: YceI family protein [Acidimicrobiales bacterium]|nr:YceI family protein [Acidimicrobiales bacterium]
MQLPVPGTWTIDKAHSSVEFVVRHLMVSKVRGRFADFSGAIEVGEDPTATSVSVSIDASTITTGDDTRDGHLRSADFFEAEAHPAVTFTSTKVEGSGEEWKLYGDLTVRGVTKPVVLDVEYAGLTGDPWGNVRIGFSASTELDREDWGLTWNQALETGGVLVGKKIKVELEVEAIRAAE